MAMPHAKGREKTTSYAAVCYLRRHGYRVFRVSGDQHNVAGHLLNTAQLKALATKIGWT